MSDLMTFPATWEEFERSYGFTDTDEVYTNGSRLIQSFRVKQWLEHMKTADAVSVVRCKDCKHLEHSWVSLDMNNNMIFHCNSLNQFVADDFFCADGERRKG